MFHLKMIELEKHTSLISYLKQRYIIYYNCFLRMCMLFTYLKHLAYNFRLIFQSTFGPTTIPPPQDTSVIDGPMVSL